MIAGIFDGLSKYQKAFGAISKYGLWGYFLAPGLISLLLGGMVYWLATNLGDDLGNWLVSWYPDNWYGSDIANGIAGYVGGILIFLLALLLYKYIILILMGPFMSPLSQKIEERITGRSFPPASAGQTINSILRGLRLSLRMIFRELFFLLCLMILSLIPVIGLASAVLSIVVQAYYAGMGNMDFTLERHFKVKGSIQFTRANRGFAIGNGLVYLGLLFIPIIGLLIAPPLATVASTLGTIERLEKSF